MTFCIIGLRYALLIPYFHEEIIIFPDDRVSFLKLRVNGDRALFLPAGWSIVWFPRDAYQLSCAIFLILTANRRAYIRKECDPLRGFILHPRITGVGIQRASCVSAAVRHGMYFFS